MPAIVVLVMAFVPFVGNMFVSNKDLIDNRTLFEKPVRFSTDFSEEWEAYYNDTFAWRKTLVKRYLKYQEKLKLNTDKFFHGLDDWMFYDSAKTSDGNTLIDYKGELVFSDADLQNMVSGIKKAQDFYGAKGIKYMILAAPNKENIYPEYMPLHWQKARVSDKSRTDRAIEYIRENLKVEIVNPKESLFAWKEKLSYPLYFKRDTHWNKIGGYAAYVEMLKGMKNIGLWVWAKPLHNSMIKETGNIRGDMDSDWEEIDYEVTYLPNVETKKVFEREDRNVTIYETSNSPLTETALIISDSFMGNMKPYVTKLFRKTIIIRRKSKTYENIEEDINEHKPNIVIDQVVERYFNKLMKYN